MSTPTGSTALIHENATLRAIAAEKEAAIVRLIKVSDELRDRIVELEREAEALRKDAAALAWIEQHLMERKWDGTIGRPHDWYIRGDYRHTMQRLRGQTLANAIEFAMQERGR